MKRQLLILIGLSFLLIGNIGTILLNELKYKTFIFYFIIDENNFYLFNKNQLEELLIKFITMPKKNDRKETIQKIKELIKKI